MIIEDLHNISNITITNNSAGEGLLLKNCSHWSNVYYEGFRFIGFDNCYCLDKVREKDEKVQTFVCFKDKNSKEYDFTLFIPSEISEDTLFIITNLIEGIKISTLIEGISEDSNVWRESTNDDSILEYLSLYGYDDNGFDN